MGKTATVALKTGSSRGGTRTPDPPVNSRLLYQLSYSGLDAVSYRLSAIGYQLSAISYRLSAISYQLSAISYQVSAIS
jgi:hypothetical protein